MVQIIVVNSSKYLVEIVADHTLHHRGYPNRTQKHKVTQQGTGPEVQHSANAVQIVNGIAKIFIVIVIIGESQMSTLFSVIVTMCWK